jgi:hypothetical protein
MATHIGILLHMEADGGKWRQMATHGGDGYTWRQMAENGGRWQQMEADGYILRQMATHGRRRQTDRLSGRLSDTLRSLTGKQTFQTDS